MKTGKSKPGGCPGEPSLRRLYACAVELRDAWTELVSSCPACLMLADELKVYGHSNDCPIGALFAAVDGVDSGGTE